MVRSFSLSRKINDLLGDANIWVTNISGNSPKTATVGTTDHHLEAKVTRI